MSQSLIVRRALDMVLSRLADPTLGFNTNHADIISSTPSYSHVPPIVLDFTPYPHSSRNLIIGKVDLIRVLKSTSISLPIFNVWTESAPNHTASSQFPKQSIYSGFIDVMLDAHISFPMSEIPRDLESPSDAVTDTLLNIFNNPTNTYQNALRGGNVQWTMRLGMKGKSTAREGAGNWEQSIGYKLEFVASY